MVVVGSLLIVIVSAEISLFNPLGLNHHILYIDNPVSTFLQLAPRINDAGVLLEHIR